MISPTTSVATHQLQYSLRRWTQGPWAALQQHFGLLSLLVPDIDAFRADPASSPLGAVYEIDAKSGTRSETSREVEHCGETSDAASDDRDRLQRHVSLGFSSVLTPRTSCRSVAVVRKSIVGVARRELLANLDDEPRFPPTCVNSHGAREWRGPTPDSRLDLLFHFFDDVDTPTSTRNYSSIPNHSLLLVLSANLSSRHLASTT